MFSLKKFQNTESDNSFSRNPGISLNLLRKLDYESDRKTIEFSLYATDDKFKSKTLIQVQVEDVNDNLPVFEESEYFGKISETVPIGRTVLTCTANDFDRSDDLKYTLEFGQENKNNNNQNMTISDFPFAIDERTGEIRVISALDYDRDVTRYTFQVKVSDGKNEETAPVTLVIQNENDNLPQISVTPVKNELTGRNNDDKKSESSKNVVIEVFENSGENGLLATVRVWDDDLENGENKFEAKQEGEDSIITTLHPPNAPFRLRQLRGFHYRLVRLKKVENLLENFDNFYTF